MQDTEKYAYWLSAVKGCTPRVCRQLLAVCQNAEEVYGLSQDALEKIPKLMHKDAMRIIESKKTWDLDHAWQELMRANIRFASMEQEGYPQQLRELADAPYGVFYRGALPEPGAFRVAIVGARMCSEYGRAVARELARELAAQDVAVVSGMARGIDAAGHRGALDSGGDTYAVFGCGVDICYPNYHRQLYYEIERHGGLVSEFLPGTKPLPGNFPRRNRLISALSDVVLIIEAKEKSGSLITADFALEQGRDVYALPGRVTDALSDGCNRLIAQGAGIILSVEDCLAELTLEAARKKAAGNGGSIAMEKEGCRGSVAKSSRKGCGADMAKGSKKGCMMENSQNQENSLENGPKSGDCEIFVNLHKFSLEKNERLVYGCLGLLPTGFEELLEKTGLDIQALSQALAALLQKRHIEEVFKNHYNVTGK